MKLNEEQQKFVADNHNLIYEFLNRHHLNIDDDEDWYGVAAIGLCKAALTYDESIGKFSTYANSCMRNEVRSVRRSSKKSVKASVSLDEPVYEKDGDIVTYGDIVEDPNSDCFDTFETKDALVKRYRKLNSRNKSIVRTMAQCNLKQADIAKEIGISRVRVNSIFRGFIRDVQKMTLG